jgi:hypothetical protein
MHAIYGQNIEMFLDLAPEPACALARASFQETFTKSTRTSGTLSSSMSEDETLANLLSFFSKFSASDQPSNH